MTWILIPSHSCMQGQKWRSEMEKLQGAVSWVCFPCPLPGVACANMDYNGMWAQHTLERWGLKYVHPTCPTWEDVYGCACWWSHPCGRNLGNNSWKTLVGLAAVPWATACCVYRQEERRAEWRMGSHGVIVFLCQLFCLVVIGLLLAFVYACVSNVL